MDLRLEGISHNYGSLKVLEGINLAIEHGKIVCVVGPSGCGKSTLLRLIGGLERPSAGQVMQIGEAPSDSLNPLTYIFQDFALLPWRTVAGNVNLVLEDQKLSRQRRRDVVENVLQRTMQTWNWAPPNKVQNACLVEWQKRCAATAGTKN